MSAEAATRGHCLCGDVQWESDGTQGWACYCHCDSCRRNCAAPVAAFLGVPDGHWRWTGTEPAVYVSTPGVRRYFCPRCGSPMAFAADRYPGEIHFYAASLEDPAAFRPESPAHHGANRRGLRSDDDLPRYGRGATEGERE